MKFMNGTSLLVLIVGIVLGLVAGGCSMKYRKMEGLLATYGYSDVPLDDNAYRVTYVGAKGTSLSDIDLYALYRCAELTVEKGYDYFVIVDRVDDANVSTEVSSNTGTTATMGPKGVQMVPTSTTTVSSRTQHTAVRMIRVFHGTKPADNPMAFDARQLLRNLDTEIEK